MIPADKGSYLLALQMDDRRKIRIGSFGEFDFLPGIYIYAGSAHGSGGLRARLGRHLRGDGKPRWHVDWLRQHAAPLAYWFESGLEARECAWAQELACLPGARVPLPGFGASDCRRGCRAHLVVFEQTGVQWVDYLPWRMV